MIKLSASDLPWCLDPLLLASLNLRGSRPNLLVNCSESDVHRVASELVRWCGAGVLLCSLPGWLDVPTEGDTLLLTRIEEMSRDQQIALHDWMTMSHPPIHVVSVATTRIDHLVRSGRFLEGLFYRLNIVQLDARGERRAAHARISGTMAPPVYAH